MNKKLILDQIIKKLTEDLAIAEKSSQSAYEAATHEESRPEDQYDTRGIEASYLAEAQAQRAAELQKMVVGLKSFNLKNFSKKDEISTGALIELKSAGKTSLVIFLPFGAGMSVPFDGKVVSVVTSASPLGQELEDRMEGDDFKLGPKTYEIVKVY